MTTIDRGKAALLEGALTDNSVPSDRPTLREVVSDAASSLEESWVHQRENFPLREAAYQLIKSGHELMQEGDVSDEERFNSLMKLVRALNSAHEFIERAEKGQLEFTLRPIQLKVFKAVVSFLERAEELAREGKDPNQAIKEFRGWIKLPTGTGKTALFVSLAQALGLKTLVVVPTQDLVHQTEGKPTEKREAKGFAKFANDVDVTTYYANSKNLTGQAVVTTYDSLPQVAAQAKAEGAEFDLVLCDEGHGSLTDIRQKALDAVPGKSIVLAFSATPDYNDEKRVGDFFGQCIATMDLDEAISEGLLVTPRMRPVKAEAELDADDFTGKGHLRDEALGKFNTKLIHDNVVQILQDDEYKGKSAAAFCLSVEHAKQMAAYLNSKGIKAAAVWGNMKAETGVEASDVLEQYEAGEIQVICSVDMLKEGWDAPRTELAFNIRPTLSNVVAEQRLGRVLRLCEELGKTHATVFEFIYQGKRGITVGDILDLGESDIFMPEDPSDELLDAIGDMRERDSNREADDWPSLMLTVEDTVEFMHKTSIAQKHIRITNDHVADFLRDTVHMTVDQALAYSRVYHGRSQSENLSGSQLLELLQEQREKLGVQETGEGLLQTLAKLASWKKRERDAYLSLRQEALRVREWNEDKSATQVLIGSHAQVIRGRFAARRMKGEEDEDSTIELPGEESKLEHQIATAVRSYTDRFGEAPTQYQFERMRIPQFGTVSVTGRTVLGVMGITKGEDFRGLMGMYCDPSRVPAEGVEPIQNLSPINVRMSEQCAKATIRDLFFSINYRTTEQIMNLQVNLDESRKTGLFVSMPEFLTGLMEVPGITKELGDDGEHDRYIRGKATPNIDVQLIEILASYAFENKLAARRATKLWQERNHIAELAARGELVAALEEHGDLHVLSSTELQGRKKIHLAGRDISAETLSRYFDKGDDPAVRDFLSQGTDQRLAQQEKELQAAAANIRGRAGEFSLRSYRCSGLLRNREVQIGSGQSISFAAVLEMAGYDSTEEGVRLFLRERVGMEEQARATFWVDDHELVRHLLTRAVRRIEAGGNIGYEFGIALEFDPGDPLKDVLAELGTLGGLVEEILIRRGERDPRKRNVYRSGGDSGGSRVEWEDMYTVLKIYGLDELMEFVS